jgi:y4mF family transcriptional regulator
MNKCIIYALVDPRTDEIRYVGKSVNGISRPKSHITFSHNNLINEWVNELRDDNYLPEIRILESLENPSQLIEKEKYWIGKLLEEGYDLLNLSSKNEYNSTMNAFNAELKRKIKEQELILEEKLKSIQKSVGDLSNIGEIIKLRRKTLQINQQTLSEISGIGLRTVKSIEKGKSNPTIETVIQILNVLGLSTFIAVKKNY